MYRSNSYPSMSERDQHVCAVRDCKNSHKQKVDACTQTFLIEPNVRDIYEKVFSFKNIKEEYPVSLLKDLVQLVLKNYSLAETVPITKNEDEICESDDIREEFKTRTISSVLNELVDCIDGLIAESRTIVKECFEKAKREEELVTRKQILSAIDSYYASKYKSLYKNKLINATKCLCLVAKDKNKNNEKDRYNILVVLGLLFQALRCNNELKDAKPIIQIFKDEAEKIEKLLDSME